ncbi:glycosyltransferase, partial [Stomatobaculum longum]
KGKVIEALYYGAPVLTTPIGAEGIPDAAQVMEIREDAADFAAETLRLYRDRDALTTMAERAARYIRTHNSMDAVWAELKDDFA